MAKKKQGLITMLHSLAVNAADFLLSQKCFKKERYDVYVYGAELVISSLINFFILILISIVFNCLDKGILFYIAFSPLRRFTGGLHCQTHLRCSLTFIFVFCSCLITDYYLNCTDIIIPAVLILSAASLLIAAIFAPIENPNKKIALPDRKKFKIISLSMLVFHLLIFVFLFSYFSYSASIIIVNDFAVAISMLAGLYVNNRRCIK